MGCVCGYSSGTLFTYDTGPGGPRSFIPHGRPVPFIPLSRIVSVDVECDVRDFVHEDLRRPPAVVPEEVEENPRTLGPLF